MKYASGEMQKNVCKKQIQPSYGMIFTLSKYKLTIANPESSCCVCCVPFEMFEVF